MFCKTKEFVNNSKIAFYLRYGGRQKYDFLGMYCYQTMRNYEFNLAAMIEEHKY